VAEVFTKFREYFSDGLIV